MHPIELLHSETLSLFLTTPKKDIDIFIAIL